ncbi:MAG: TraR/DksA family transcriptional regulator [Bacteriovoracaceae bacterium]|nr:TraR/DksA family transcriptional regulator [Bacteriovoracaceae bacterium]
MDGISNYLSMEENERKKFKILIEKSIEDEHDNIESLKKNTQPVSPDNAIGRLSRMEAISEKSVFDASLRKAELRLRSLEGALNRVELEDFGICSECAEPIPMKRLRAVPYSSSCISCLESHDG